MMKKLFAGILLLICSTYLVAQPVSGFLGKKLMTSFECEIIPGIQKYEANISDFLAPGLITGREFRSYTPRVFVNTDYQFKRNTALSVGLGYVRMQVPLYPFYTSSQYFVRPMNSFPIHIRLKNGTKGGNMPTSSAYIAYGLSLQFLNMPSVPFGQGFSQSGFIVSEVANVSALNFGINFEVGRRIVFNPGIILDFGIVTNITTGLFDIDDYNSANYSLVGIGLIDEFSVKDQMRTRAALNSLFNFKIGIGVFY